jgi:hypothetical protein
MRKLGNGSDMEPTRNHRIWSYYLAAFFKSFLNHKSAFTPTLEESYYTIREKHGENLLYWLVAHTNIY